MFETGDSEYLANPPKIRILGVIRSSLATRKLHQLFEKARARPQIARSSYYPADGARIIVEGRGGERGARKREREMEREIATREEQGKHGIDG